VGTPVKDDHWQPDRPTRPTEISAQLATEQDLGSSSVTLGLRVGR